MCEQRGLNVTVREAEPEDSPALVEIIAQIDHETEFLGKPDERLPGADHSEAFLRTLRRTGHGAYFIGVESGEIVGYLDVTAPRLPAVAGPYSLDRLAC